MGLLTIVMLFGLDRLLNASFAMWGRRMRPGKASHPWVPLIGMKKPTEGTGGCDRTMLGDMTLSFEKCSQRGLQAIALGSSRYQASRLLSNVWACTGTISTVLGNVCDFTPFSLNLLALEQSR